MRHIGTIQYTTKGESKTLSLDQLQDLIMKLKTKCATVQEYRLSAVPNYTRKNEIILYGGNGLGESDKVTMPTDVFDEYVRDLMGGLDMPVTGYGASHEGWL